MILDKVAAVRAAAIILASGSPRRIDILNNILQLGATVVPSTFPEDLDKSLFTPKEYVQENARRKALEVYERLTREQGSPPSLVIGADTVVVNDNTILEKPKSTAAACAMLSSLSGRSHSVCTGVALVYAPLKGDEPDVVVFVESSDVNFAELRPELIDAYVASGEPMDKAGSYGIQGMGGSFVTGISGCYFNVVGFPIHAFTARLDCDRLEQWVREHGEAKRPKS